jgi:Flp pilus assembly protein TadD
MNAPFQLRRAAALVFALPLLVCACAQVEHTVRGPVEAIVAVPAVAEGHEDKLVVEASPNRDCQAGVRAMRNSDWAVAITAFDRALRDDAADYRALYARGVSSEMLGRFEDALRDYRASNENAPSQSLACLTAIERVKTKLGR